MRTRSSNLAEDTALSFAKQMDDYITNSAVFKEAILKAFNVAVNEIIKPINEEIASLHCQVKMLKSKLTEVTTKANDNEQYSRRNNIRIFGLAETEGEDCYDVVLKLCQNDLDINVTRDELDRAHRVGKPKKSRDGQTSPPPRAMIVKLAGHSVKMKFFRARRKLGPKRIFINEDLTKENHKLLLYVKKRCPEGVSVYSVDGSIMARTSDRVYRIQRKEDLEKFALIGDVQDAEVAEEQDIAEQDG